MNIQTNNKTERLALFRALYEQAKNAFSEEQAALERHVAQYRGSTDIDGSTERAATVRNITYEIIESQVSSDIPNPKVDPVSYSERRDRCAKAIERLCQGLRARLPFEELNDLDERYTYVLGGSVWFMEWDNGCRDFGERGGVRVRCLSPRDFIPQPSVSRIEDMDYCFLRFTSTRAELCRSYGLREEQLTGAALEPDAAITLADDDCATVTVCFYRDGDGEVGQFIFSGELTLLDLPAYYRRKRRVCPDCGREASLCRCEKKKRRTDLQDDLYETVYRKTVLENGELVQSFVYKSELGETSDEAVLSLEELRVPYYTPKEFPIVIRKNTSAEGRVLGQSDCEFIRPEQQAINKIESRILQKLLRAGITPVVPEDASVTLNNAVFGQVIKMKPGESLAQYGTVDTTPNIAQDIAEAERLYDHAKRTLGITDAYQGADNERNKSGYARQLQIDRASGRLRSKRTMKQAAYAKIDRILFSFYLAYADEPRMLTFRDAYGRIHNEAFRRLDFLTYDRATDGYVYDDGYLFSIDQNGAAEEARSELWQRNLENLRSGALGDPSEAVTLLRYWQAQERAHYPYARENVEYFRDALDEGGGTPCNL